VSAGDALAADAVRPNRLSRSVLLLAPTLALLLLLAAGLGDDPSARPAPAQGRPMPAFDLSRADGGEVRSGRLAGHVVVINFFASWCEACRTEAGALGGAAASHGADVRFLSIAFMDRAGDAESFHRASGHPWPMLLDPDDRVAIDFGVAGVPETYVIDTRGIVTERFIGPVGRDSLDAAILDALATGGSR
jgi:cytochrome c biogenesis protein CcmG/thiol:disulfide interchange protein DsbE